MTSAIWATKLSSEFRSELNVWLILLREPSFGHWLIFSMTKKSETGLCGLAPDFAEAISLEETIASGDLEESGLQQDFSGTIGRNVTTKEVGEIQIVAEQLGSA
jgi:hypothetical protein